MKLPKQHQNAVGSIFMYARFLIIIVIMMGLIVGAYEILQVISPSS